MAEPVVTPRSVPAGIMLDDGHPTVIAFAADPDVSFWERTVTPPGVDGGDPVETETMHNVTWRTRGARKLKEMTESSTTVGYDPGVFAQIVALINVETSITVHFSDGSTLSFFGYLRSFEPSEISEGELPEAEITIQPTNKDPDTGEEQGPITTAASGVGAG